LEDRTTPVPVTALGSDVVEAATGYGFTCAIKRDGSLWCWGSNQAGELAIRELDGGTNLRCRHRRRRWVAVHDFVPRPPVAVVEAVSGRQRRLGRRKLGFQ
jgi:hypothetical protein